jgi:prepilin-type N-terminal cleavage/methylation domain-containing protein
MPEGMPMRKRNGFTLVELLVVIGVIALLISILLPSLNKARMAAVRTQCMSNQRQVLIGLEMYKANSRGKMPIYIPGGNMAGSAIIRFDKADHDAFNAPLVPAFPKGRRGTTIEGWSNLGWVVYGKYIKDGRIFYCPTSTYFGYDDASWKRALSGESFSRIWSGYVYRIGGHGSTGALDAYPKDRDDERLMIDKAVAGKVKGSVRSLTTEMYGYNPIVPGNWPHQRPYGMCVGWTDGHVSYVVMDAKDWYIIRGWKELADTDKHMHMLFRWAFDENNLGKVRKALGIIK